ncbi:putative integral membrane protein [Acanthocheilonema viteae]|uniref:Uncharacterized protein n=1 Tax=Acanthocheilonema viteae TaxID=6277 RepID=A0A498SQ08_ACAVI|nr:unnamed protein product [Acanthocheilonema viteae]
MYYQRWLCLQWWLFFLIITVLGDLYDFHYPSSSLSSSSLSLSSSSSSSSSLSSPSYLRRLANRDGLIRERDGTHRIMKIYHYDNLTDCESACEIPCGTTYVIRNDIDERRQFICMQRKTPVVSSFINISTTGIIPFILAAAVILCCLLLITCCCCMRCGSACCQKMCHSRNSSNDPLVNGEFRETLDSKDIGYLRKEADRKIITV